MYTTVVDRPCDPLVGWPPAPDAAPRPITVEPAHAFSTCSIEPALQFDAWRAQCGAFVELLAPPDRGAGYRARCVAWKFGPFAFVSASASAARYRRDREQVRRDAIDHWVVKLARRGAHRMRTASGLVVQPAGLPFIFSLASAYEGERSDPEWVSLVVPRDAFPGLAPVMDRSLHAPLEHSLGLLLGRYLESLEAHLPEMTEAELPRLVAATRAVVAACVAPSAAARDASAPLIGHAQLERTRQAIRRNLRSPTLTPKRLCRMVGMSRTQLYRLFEPMGGVARYIQAERLREAHRSLADPCNTRRIQEVAEDLGFFDASTFSRMFRREYGCAPGDVRAAALAGAGGAALRRAPEQAPAGTIMAVLRALQ